MNQPWSSIVESLRLELAEYGGLLHFFEQQEAALFARDADAVLRISTDIESQVRTIHSRRRTREALVAAFATANDQPPATTLRTMIPLFAEEARPLLDALVREINVLVHRVRRISRHNHMLLGRAVETHQQTLRVLRPDAFTQTYAPNGRASITTSAGHSALQAAG